MKNTTEQNNRGSELALWTVQGLLAAIFLFADGMKLVTPVDAMLKQMPIALPGLFLKVIGLSEAFGGIGLILPGLLRIRRELTPLAASGLGVIMSGATVYTVAGGGGATALIPLVVGLFAALVAYGRRSFLLRAQPWSTLLVARRDACSGVVLD